MTLILLFFTRDNVGLRQFKHAVTVDSQYKVQLMSKFNLVRPLSIQYTVNEVSGLNCSYVNS